MEDEISGLDSQVLLSATLCAQAPYLAQGMLTSHLNHNNIYIECMMNCRC